MRNILLIFLSIGLTTLLISNFPISVDYSSKLLRTPKDLSCNELIPALPQNVITLKVINQSRFDSVDHCLSQYANENNILLVADKQAEDKILEEMMRQSELPTDPDSFIKIGQMLTPSHLLIINEIKENSLFMKIEHSLYQIKSGRVLSKGSRSFSFYDLYYDYIKTIVNYMLTFIILFLSIKAIESPIHRLYQARIDRTRSHQNFEKALVLIKSHNMLDGTDVLVSVANDNIKGGASPLAIEKLKNMKKFIE